MQVYWFEQTEADVPLQNDWLSPSEKFRLSGMRFARRRADWTLGRWTAKRALVSYLELPNEIERLAKIEIRASPSGAPEAVIANQPAGIAMSLTHRDGTAACALAPAGIALGCDLEIVEPHSDAFLSDYFTADEQAFVAGSANPSFLLALLWSAKESALKALGVGLRADTRSVAIIPEDLSFGLSNWNRLKVNHVSGRVFEGWCQQSGLLIRTLVADPATLPPIFLRSNASYRSKSDNITPFVTPKLEPPHLALPQTRFIS